MWITVKLYNQLETCLTKLMAKVTRLAGRTNPERLKKVGASPRRGVGHVFHLLLRCLPLGSTFWLGVLLLPILEGVPVSRLFSLFLLFVELAVPKDIGISFATSVAVSRRFVSCDASFFPGAIMLSATMVAWNIFSITMWNMICWRCWSWRVLLALEFRDVEHDLLALLFRARGRAIRS